MELKIPALKGHVFLVSGVDGTRRKRKLLDVPGLRLLLSALRSQAASDRALQLIQNIADGDPAITKQMIANNESTRDLAGISAVATYKFARSRFNDALKACLEAAPALRKKQRCYYSMFTSMLQGAVAGHAVATADLNEGERVALTQVYHEAAETLRGAMEVDEKSEGWMKVVEDRVHAVATKAKHSRLATPPSHPQDA